MILEYVDLSKINLNDKTFFIKSKPISQDFIDSVRELGVINPIILQKNLEAYTVITGWKRIGFALKNKIQKIHSKIYSADEINFEKCLKIIYYDNKDRITELGKAELVKKFIDLSKVDNNYLKDVILPYFDLPPTFKQLERLKKLYVLEEDIKDSFYNDQLSIEQIHILAELKDNKLRSDIFQKILLTYKFNNNETRELVRDIFDIANRNVESQILKLKDILNSKNQNLSKHEFRRKIKSLRFPRYYRTEEKLKEIINSSKLTGRMQLLHHPYFETNDLEIRFKVNSEEELRDVIESLSEFLSNNDMERILKLLKRGSE